jgi:hypothetical protein
MSLPAYSFLEMMRNPVNLRRGAQYTGIPDGVSTPSIEPEVVALVEPESHREESDKSAPSTSRGGHDVGPTPPNLESPQSAADEVREDEDLVHRRPPNAVNLRHGAHYAGLQVPKLRVASEGGETDQSQQDERRVDSATSEAAPTPTPIAEARNSRPIDPVQEWYRGFQIAEFIRYTEDCLTARPPRPLTTFYNVTTIAHPYPTPACLMLREAHHAGLAQLARSTDATEVYTVGAPPPATQFNGGFGPHWWVGKTPAQVLAGPMPEYRDVRNAQKRLDRRTNQKQYRNRHLDDQRRKTVEGVRRQELGLPMCDDEDGDVEMPDA